MDLKELNLRPIEILLDRVNPRYFHGLPKSQEAIIEFVMRQKGTKELANSMQLKLQWINKIVVIKLDDGKYQVVEGNTRLTILKSGEITGYNNTSKSKRIPVLLASKEKNETDDEFKHQLRTIQGMANVLAVKEWPAVVKAKFIYDGFNLELSQNGGNIADAVRSLAHMNGTSTNEIAKTIRMYSFFDKISELSKGLKENQYSMMEGFNKNQTTRMFFGFNDMNYRFELGTPGNQNTMQSEFQQRLEQCDLFIENVSALTFRKKITCVIEDKDNSEKFEKIIDPDDELGWESADLCGDIDENIQDKWEKILKGMVTTLGKIPVGSDEWTNKGKIINLLNDVSKKALRQKTMMEYED